MTAQPPRYPLEETARRGQEIYLRDILPLYGETRKGEYAVIDIETGEYEMGNDAYATSQKLLTRQPSAQMWLVRVGYQTAIKMGGHGLRVKGTAS